MAPLRRPRSGIVLRLMVGGGALAACLAGAPPPALAEGDAPLGLGSLMIIGRHETVALADGGTRIRAKVDTGADSSSVDAREIEAFERDGEEWVRFELWADDDRTISMERPIADEVIIISSNGRQRRYVIELDLCVGEIQRTAEVNLADREDLDFRMLLGRDFMIEAGFLVNVAQEYSSEPGCDGMVER